MSLLNEDLKKIFGIAPSLRGLFDKGKLHGTISYHTLKAATANIDDKDISIEEVARAFEANGIDIDHRADVVEHMPWDPVRTYLRTVGAIELLSRDEEVVIAKQIEDAQSKAIELVWSLDITYKVFTYLLERLQNKEINTSYLFDQEKDEIHEGKIKEKDDDDLDLHDEKDDHEKHNEGVTCLTSIEKIEKMIDSLSQALVTRELQQDIARLNLQRIDEIIDTINNYNKRLIESEQDLFLTAGRMNLSKIDILSHFQQLYNSIHDMSLTDHDHKQAMYAIFESMLQDEKLSGFAYKSRGRIMKFLELLEEIKSNTYLSITEFKKIALSLRISANKSNTAKERMIRCNLRLVVSVAKKYINRGLPLLDLIQEANFGLMKAVSKFSWKKGCKFSTYATCWIKQSITRAISDKGRLVRLPVHMLETRNRIVRIAARYFQEHGAEPSDQELVELSGLSLEKVKKTYSILKDNVVHLETTSIGDGKSDDSLLELVADETAESPLDAAIARDIRIKVGLQLSQLNPREERIIRMRNGLERDEIDHTLESVGKSLGVTRERVRQVENRAWALLKNPKYTDGLIECIDNVTDNSIHHNSNKNDLEDRKSLCSGTNSIIGLSAADLAPVKRRRRKKSEM